MNKNFWFSLVLVIFNGFVIFASDSNKENSKLIHSFYKAVIRSSAKGNLSPNSSTFQTKWEFDNNPEVQRQAAQAALHRAHDNAFLEMNRKSTAQTTACEIMSPEIFRSVIQCLDISDDDVAEAYLIDILENYDA